MQSLKIFVLILCAFFEEGFCGPTSSLDEYHHRTTTLDELKQIDEFVASGLPLFDHGFFVNTAQGPILVKQKEEGAKQNKPRLNPGYYSQLPRLIPSSGGIPPLGPIPAGFEGISISHFNLGSAIPAHSPTYFTHHSSSPVYTPQPQFAAAPQFSQAHGHYHPESISYPSQQLTQQSNLRARHNFAFNSNLQSPIQTQSHHFIQHHPQRRQDRYVDHYSQQHQRQRHQSPVAQGTFQINNYLNAEDEREDDNVPTSYQNTMISHEPFSERKLIRNPTVEQASRFEDTLPDNLKNKFYKNQALASALAKESLPVEGETIVGEWDTKKIQKMRIMDLLRAAGFLS